MKWRRASQECVNTALLAVCTVVSLLLGAPVQALGCSLVTAAWAALAVRKAKRGS
jgi:hypothetical protein